MSSDNPVPDLDQEETCKSTGSTDDVVSKPDQQIFVLDTSAFFLSVPLVGHLYTVPRVEREIKDLRGKARFAMLVDEGMDVRAPGKQYCKETAQAAVKTGDATVLSDTDADLLALAKEIGGTLVTDDFAIQNTAHILKIPVQSIIQRSTTLRIRQIRCTGCGKYYDELPDKTGDCPICGSALKRKHK
jgi:UPF0271 protein